MADSPLPKQSSDVRSRMIGRKPKFPDKRRKHEHFLVTVTYVDGGSFGRVYLDRDKAQRFAKRQKKCPVVKRTLVQNIG